MIKYIYNNLKVDLDAGLRKQILNAITEEFKNIEAV